MEKGRSLDPTSQAAGSLPSSFPTVAGAASRRTFWTLLLAAAGAHLAYFLAYTILFGVGWRDYALFSDAASYAAYAELLLGRVQAIDAHDGRVFPGLPAATALVALPGLSVPLAQLLYTFACGAFVPALAALVFRDARVGWATVVFPPIWLAGASMVGSEAPMLALSLAGLAVVLAPDRPRLWHAAVAGVLLGLAGATRPVACFAAAGLIALLISRRRTAHAAVVGGASLAVVVAALLLVRAFFGDAMAGVRTYAADPRAYGGSSMFAPPFWSLLTTPTRVSIQSAKIAYAYLHALAMLVGLALLAVALVKRRGDDGGLVLLAFVWLAGNSIFALSVGGDWGFHIFPRLLVPALPPLVWAFARLGWLPRPRLWWAYAGVFVLSLAVALYQGRPR